jgi:hypothetical protein
MEFGTVIRCNDKWKANQNKLLRLEDRASHNARLEFKSFSSSTLKDYKKRTHGLSLPDPFDASFLYGYVTL